MSDPRTAEIRISWVGGGPLVVRGRLAWLLLKLALKSGALQPKVDALRYGALEAHWGDREEPSVRVVDTQAA